jgi:hypothetical protein
MANHAVTDNDNRFALLRGHTERFKSEPGPSQLKFQSRVIRKLVGQVWANSMPAISMLRLKLFNIMSYNELRSITERESMAHRAAVAVNLSTSASSQGMAKTIT